LEDARKTLRHSQSQYRAPLDNPACEILSCNAAVETMAVNQAFASMLGYESNEELRAAKPSSDLLSSLGKGSSLAGHTAEARRIDPVEIEWKRKDGTSVKARLSGRRVYDDRGRS
jgi:PAS domain S-box-containing protein